MKESGIVRKLDNLGRLVIPKEIRRCMRIKEGSPIEFGLLPSGEIVLCKYSLVGQVVDYADDFCQILGEVFDCGVLISDRDKIISCYGLSKKNSLGAKLSSEALDILDSQASYTACRKENTTIIPIMEEDMNTYYAQIIIITKANTLLIQNPSTNETLNNFCSLYLCLSLRHLATSHAKATFIPLPQIVRISEYTGNIR